MLLLKKGGGALGIFLVDIDNAIWYTFTVCKYGDAESMDVKLNLENKEVKIGLKETMRALRNGSVESVILANDADEFVTRKVLNLALSEGIDIVYVSKKSKLGDILGIDVAAATAVIIK